MRKFAVVMAVMTLILANFYWQPARAASPIYVRPDGDDTYCNGTANIPYVVSSSPNCAVKTISKGVELVSPSGIVYVAAGNYSEYVYISKSLSLEGAGATLTEIASISDKINVDGAAVTVRGFTIRHAAENGIKYYNGASGTIENNIIKENGKGICIENASATIWNNTITNNETGISVSGEYDTNTNACTTWSEVVMTGNTISNNIGDGVYNSACSRVIMTNNLVIDNDHVGISNNAFEVENDITITNNTIVSNGEEGISNTMGTRSTITNNIIASNDGSGIYADGWSAAVCTYNDVWGNANNDFGDPGTGSISQGPLFVSATNLHLQCSSPAVDAGTNTAPAIPTTDKDGHPRIIGGRADMGAYESICISVQEPPISISNPVIPIAQNHINQGTKTVKEASDLLSQAESKGLDTAACEALIDEAKELLDKAKKSLTNPIYANNLALKAMEKMRQAMDCLKELLG